MQIQTVQSGRPRGTPANDLGHARRAEPSLKQLGWVTALAVVLAGLSSPAMAQDGGFRSPTGNIHCQYVEDDDPTVRCDLIQMTNRPPPRPADCNLDWGKAFEISAKATAGTRLCHGDTVQSGSLPVLPYGQQFRRERILCTSSQEGIECRNTNGFGFKIARASQTLW